MSLIFGGEREPVAIERGDALNGPGMPRPLARNKGTLRPVPWTNADDWGILADDRARKCDMHSLCLVCGLHVEEGYIFAMNRSCPAVVVHQDDLYDFASDHGPVHARCAKMTVAHCRKVRSDLLNGETWLVRYCRQNPLRDSDIHERMSS